MSLFRRATETTQEATRTVLSWPRRILRWLIRSTEVVIILTLLMVGGIAWLLGNLNHPEISQPITIYLRDNLGLDIRFKHLNAAPLSDITAQEFVIASPKRFARWAPDFLSLKSLEMHWSPSTALTNAPDIEKLSIDGLHITIVKDETGKTSLDYLLPETASATTPTPPSETPFQLSHVMELYPAGLHVGELSLTNVSVTLLEVDGERLTRKTEVTGLSLFLEAKPTPAQEPWLKATVGAQKDKSLSLTVQAAKPAGGPDTTSVGKSEDTAASTELETRELTAQTALIAELEGRRLKLSLDVELVSQSLLALPLPAGKLAQLASAIELQPDKNSVSIRIDSLGILQEGLTFSGTILWPDQPSTQAPPTLSNLALTSELKPVLPLITLPQGLSLSSGSIALKSETLALDPATLMPSLGTVTLKGSIPGIEWEAGPTASGSTQARIQQVSLSSQVEVPALNQLKGEIQVQGTGIQYAVTNASAKSPGGTESGQHPTPDRVNLRSLMTTLRLKSVTLDPEDYAKSVADVALDVALGGLDGTLAGARLTRGDMRLNATSVYGGKLPEALQLGLNVDTLTVGLEGLAPLKLDRLSLTTDLTGMALNSDTPMLSTGVASLRLGWAPLPTTLRLQKQRTPGNEQLTFALKSSLEVSEPYQTFFSSLLGPTQKVQWNTLKTSVESIGTIALTSTGDVKDIAQSTILRTRGLNYRSHDGKGTTLALDAQELGLELKSKGSREVLTTDLTVQSPMLMLSLPGKADLKELLISSHFDINLLAAQYGMKTTADIGRKRALTARLKTQADAHAKRLTYDLDSELTAFPGLDELLTRYGEGVRILPGTPFSVELKSDGALTGLLESVTDGVPVIAEKPKQPLDGRIALQLSTHGLLWQGEDQRLTLPTTTLTGTLGLNEGALDGTFRLLQSGLKYQSGTDTIAFETGTHTLNLKSPPGQTLNTLSSMPVQVSMDSALKSFGQSYTDWVGTGGLTLAIKALYHPGLALRLDELTLSGPQWGTDLTVQGVYDLRSANGGPVQLSTQAQALRSFAASPPGGQVMTFKGTLKQQLKPLSAHPDQFSGTGEVTIPFQLDSPDQNLYQLAGALKFANVSMSVPTSKLKVEALTGSIQWTEAVRQVKDQWQLIPGEQRNAWTRTRFTDAQPFLASNSYFSLKSLQYEDLTFTDMAGNLELDRELFRLDQLQLSAFGGAIAGQLLYQYDPQNAQVLFRGTASGLRFTDAQERLDANLALTLQLGTLELNGQTNMVRVGQKTLLAALDVLDPYQEDVSYNRVRMGLKVGYPEAVRLGFDHGLMNAKIELGGAARQLRIDEIRGVAVGPLLNRYLLPYLPARSTHE